MQTETAVRFRITPKMRSLLDRLRDEADINVSAWVRRHIENALRERFPEEFETAAETPEPQTPEPQQPIAGWKPRKVRVGDKEVWGAALQGPEVAQLPMEIRGTPILVTNSGGKVWNTTIEEVVSRSEDLIVVRRPLAEADGVG